MYSSSGTRDASSTSSSVTAENPRIVSSLPGSPTIREPLGNCSDMSLVPSPFVRIPSRRANPAAFRTNSPLCRPLGLTTSDQALLPVYRLVDRLGRRDRRFPPLPRAVQHPPLARARQHQRLLRIRIKSQLRRTHSAASTSSFRSGSRPRSGHPFAFHTPINSSPPPQFALQSAPESPDHRSHPIDSKPDLDTLTKSVWCVIGQSQALPIFFRHSPLAPIQLILNRIQRHSSRSFPTRSGFFLGTRS